MPDEISNLIYVGPHGTFGTGDTYHSTPISIDALFAKMEQDQCQHVVIYFHGGLVDKRSGEESANFLGPYFCEIGAQPIFFIWETGPWETVRDNLTNFFNTALVRKLLLYILGQVAKRWGIDVGGKGTAGQSLSTAEMEAELSKPYPFAAWDVPIIEGIVGAKGGVQIQDEADLELVSAEMEVELDEQVSQDALELEATLPEAASKDMLKPEIRQAAANAVNGGGKGILETASIVKTVVSIALRVIKRRMEGLDHGLYPTVAEELLREISLDEGIGKPLWDAMKEKAAEMWLPNPSELTSTNAPDAHTGTYFLDDLIAYGKKHPELKVDLVGHSAGSIVICELLKSAAARYPDFKFRRIALLAPAATTELFASELLCKPERFETFRMYTMLDKWECFDAIAGRVYPRSLLYFVSGLLEEKPATPLIGLERCATGAKPYNTGSLLQVNEFLHMKGQDRLVTSLIIDALPGLNSNSAHHGDFDNDPTTIKSLQVFLKP